MHFCMTKILIIQKIEIREMMRMKTKAAFIALSFSTCFSSAADTRKERRAVWQKQQKEQT